MILLAYVTVAIVFLWHQTAVLNSKPLESSMKTSVDLCESEHAAISTSLLASIKVGKVPRRFSLGRNEYVGPEHFR